MVLSRGKDEVGVARTHVLIIYLQQCSGASTGQSAKMRTSKIQETTEIQEKQLMALLVTPETIKDQSRKHNNPASVITANMFTLRILAIFIMVLTTGAFKLAPVRVRPGSKSLKMAWGGLQKVGQSVINVNTQTGKSICII